MWFLSMYLGSIHLVIIWESIAFAMTGRRGSSLLDCSFGLGVFRQCRSGLLGPIFQCARRILRRPRLGRTSSFVAGILADHSHRRRRSESCSSSGIVRIASSGEGSIALLGH